MRFVAQCLMLSAVVAGLGACATPPPPRVAGPAAGEDRSAVSEREYSIGVNDQLNISVWRHDDLSVVVPVRPDGKISTPLVEDMQAAGKTPTELGRDIETVLGEYIKSPAVTVIVTSFLGESRDQIRVIIAGQPRALPYTQGATLLDILIDAGGLTEFAAPKRAKIIRRTATGVEEIPIRPDLLLQRGDFRYNLEMRPGDVLIVPEARF